MIDNIITIAIGVWAALVGYGKVPLSKNPDANSGLLKKYGMAFRIGGIVLIVIGVVFIVARQI